MKYQLKHSERHHTPFSVKLAGYVLILVLGGLIGCLLFLWAFPKYVGATMQLNDPLLNSFMIDTSAETLRSLKWPTAFYTGGLKILKPETTGHVCQRDDVIWWQAELCVTDNHSEQKTAPIHKLEPKVSDAYLQWGDNPQKVGRNR